MYPIGKICRYPDDESKPEDLIPEYFYQSIPTGMCRGADLAAEENITHKFIDWIGGEEKRKISDRYSVAFSSFMQNYLDVFESEKYQKIEKEIRDTFMNLLLNLIYIHYDYSVDDNSFLSQMDDNFHIAIGRTKILMNDPTEFKRTVKNKNQN